MSYRPAIRRADSIFWLHRVTARVRQRPARRGLLPSAASAKSAAQCGLTLASDVRSLYRAVVSVGNRRACIPIIPDVRTCVREYDLECRAVSSLVDRARQPHLKVDHLLVNWPA